MNKLNGMLVAMVLFTTMAVALNASAGEVPSGGQVININTATVAELSFLPGVGESKAQAIVKYRTNRQFKKVEDLMRIKGIGRKTFRKLSPYLSVKGATTVKGKLALSK